METLKGNTAAMGATSKIDSVQWKKEAQYMVSMTMFRRWHDEGLLTDDEYRELEHQIMQKYSAKVCTLWA